MVLKQNTKKQRINKKEQSTDLTVRRLLNHQLRREIDTIMISHLLRKINHFIGGIFMRNFRRSKLKARDCKKHSAKNFCKKALTFGRHNI